MPYRKWIMVCDLKTEDLGKRIGFFQYKAVLPVQLEKEDKTLTINVINFCDSPAGAAAKAAIFAERHTPKELIEKFHS